MDACQRYSLHRINFFHTTETATYPAFVLPTLADLGRQGVRRPRVVGISSAGQILDYLASLGSLVEEAVLVDINPCQNLYLAGMLAAVVRFATPGELRAHLCTRRKAEVLDDLQSAVRLFPELAGYPRRHGLELDGLAEAMVCREPPDEDPFTQRHLSPRNLRYLFLVHEPWCLSLRELCIKQRISFVADRMEEHERRGRGYHVVYLSDIHPWTDGRKLARCLPRLLAPGGWFMSALCGFDGVYHQERADHDRRFVRLLESLEVFSLEVGFSDRSARVWQQMRESFAMRETGWSDFIAETLGFPSRQSLPLVGRLMGNPGKQRGDGHRCPQPSGG